MKGDPLVRWILAFFFALPFPRTSLAQADDFAERAPAESEGTSFSAIGENYSDNETKAETDPRIAKMTLEQKIGQLLILGFSGRELSSNLKRSMDVLKPGSVILFKHNLKTFKQVATLNRDLQTYSHETLNLPLFIMIDQEGGSVSRIKTTPPLPSALAMGRSNNPILVERLGLRMGELLQLVGINMNLAPVLDLGDPDRKSFIGNRAFSGDPARASQMALAFSAGLNSASVIPTAKHFPGHGGLTQDSHKHTPSKLASLEELEATDLVPFKNFSAIKTPTAMMVAHVAFPNIDTSGLPAAFSSTMIHDVLRTKLNYQGLVITDDIEMLGADMAGSIEERAIKAIEAGCDMVMVAWSPRRQSKAFHGLLQAARSGRLPMKRIDESVLRILNAKAFLTPSPKPGPAVFNRLVQSKVASLGHITKQIAKANFRQGSSLYAGKTGRLPASQAVTVFSGDPAFYSQFLMARPKNDVRFKRLTPKSLNKIESEMLNAPDRVGIYFATGSVTARVLASFSKEVKQRLIIVNGAYPGAIDTREQFKMVIDLNTPEPESGRWLAEQFVEGTLAPLEDLPQNPDDMRQPSSTGENPDNQALNSGF